MKYIEIKNIARRLRKNPTYGEKALWPYLSKRQLGGYRFLRQHPLYYEHNNNQHFFFIPDFYCAELKLILELDGAIHHQRKEHDEHRDAILKSNGFKILRIKNEELSEIESLKTKILQFIEKNYPS